MTRYPAARRAAGFSILELMFVIVIIGVLGAIVSYNLIGAADRAKRQATLTTMKTVQGALKMYRASYNAYPPTALGLQWLVDDRVIDGYIDGWGNRLEYYSPTQLAAYELISMGEDGHYGDANDIRMVPENEQ